MLEERTYTKDEIADVLGGGRSATTIKKKLNGYGVQYSTSGRGSTLNFHIDKIPNKFQLYCITELKIPPQIQNYNDLLFFYHEFLCTDEFKAMNSKEKADFMSENGHPISRQTASKWISYLAKNNYFSDYCSNSSECRFYFAHKGNNIPATAEQYANAWKYYFAKKREGFYCGTIMNDIIQKYGGVPKKHKIPQENAFYISEVNELIDIITNQIDYNSNQTINT